MVAEEGKEMSTSERYAWCIFFASGLAAWAIAGPLGFICLVGGMAVSHIEVGWIDQHIARLNAPETEPEPDPGEVKPAPKPRPSRDAGY